MTIDQFNASLQFTAPPEGLTNALLAMWHDAKGEWERAHELVQDGTDTISCRIHAYLHRREGDEFNAGYWYRKANLAPSTITLGEEWKHIVEDLMQ